MITCQTAIETISQMKRGLLKYKSNYEKYLMVERIKIVQGQSKQVSEPGSKPRHKGSLLLTTTLNGSTKIQWN